MAPNQTHAAEEMLLPLVDLSRERRAERRSVLRGSRRHAAGFVVVIALTLTIPLPLTLQALALRQECQKAAHQAAGVRVRLQAMTTTGGEMDAKISQWTQLSQSQQARQAWEATLPSLAACLPDDVSLQQVEISSKDKSAQVHLQGSARTMAGLRAFTAALLRSSLFAHLHLDETTTGASGVNFQITGPVSSAIASSAIAGGAEPTAP